jgi:hypothetical protein
MDSAEIVVLKVLCSHLMLVPELYFATVVEIHFLEREFLVLLEVAQKV